MAYRIGAQFRNLSNDVVTIIWIRPQTGEIETECMGMRLQYTEQEIDDLIKSRAWFPLTDGTPRCRRCGYANEYQVSVHTCWKCSNGA